MQKTRNEGFDSPRHTAVVGDRQSVKCLEMCTPRIYFLLGIEPAVVAYLSSRNASISLCECDKHECGQEAELLAQQHRPITGCGNLLITVSSIPAK